MKQKSKASSSAGPEHESDMRTPDQRELVVTVRRADLICAARRREEDTLVWQPDVEFGAEFHGFGRATLKPAAPVRSVAGKALLEYFDQKLDIGQADQTRKLVLQGWAQGLHDSQSAVRHGHGQAVAALIGLERGVTVERGLAMREYVVDQLGEDRPRRTFQFIGVGALTARTHQRVRKAAW